MLVDKLPYYGSLKPLLKDAEGKPKYMLGPHCNESITKIWFF